MLIYAAIAYCCVAWIIVALFVCSELTPYTALTPKEVARLILVVLFAPAVLPLAVGFAWISARFWRQ